MQMVEKHMDCDKAHNYISKITIVNTTKYHLDKTSMNQSISYRCIKNEEDYEQERKRLKTETGYVAVY